MRLAKTLIFAAVVCMSAAAFADAIFSNQNGNLMANNGVVSVASSELIKVSGLGNGYDGAAPPSLGTVKFSSGSLSSGSIAGSAVFNSGGSFKINGTNGTGGFVFKGTFTAGGTWTKSGSVNSWVFFGTIMNGMISENHGAFVAIPGAVTTQLTTVILTGNPFTPANNGSIKLAGGTTTFPANTTAPEPGTLALFGTGLVCIGMIAKRRVSKSRSNTGAV
jgi:hypothetical protein